MKKIDTLWEQYEAMVYKIVWKIWRRTAEAADLNEMMGIAQLTFCDVARKFSKQRGTKFSSLLYPSVSGALYNHIRTATRIVTNETHNEEFMLSVGSADSKRAVEFWAVLTELDGDSKTLADYVLDPPAEVLASMKSATPWFLGAQVKRYLMEHEGWSRHRFYQASAGLRHILV